MVRVTPFSEVRAMLSEIACGVAHRVMAYSSAKAAKCHQHVTHLRLGSQYEKRRASSARAAFKVACTPRAVNTCDADEDGAAPSASVQASKKDSLK
eukprot:1309171-Pleurochrysis_carterae.AAC.2